MSWETFDEIFSLPSGASFDTCCQNFLAVPIDNITLYLEITLAFPQKCKDIKNLTLIEKVNLYRSVFNNFKAEYQATEGAYEIEYHENGMPHLHGHIKVSLHPNVFAYPTEELLKMFAKSIFLKFNRTIYKQYAKADVNAYLKRFKSPLLTLNIKNHLETGWVNYINKNACVQN